LEYDGKTDSWVPFTQNDVQLEFVMLDPYYRITLNHNGKGHYFTRFVLPDVYGVYKFRIQYRKPGFSNLEFTHVIPVHPYRHDEFDRFLVAAFPYYVTAFSMMGGFFLLGIVFLYHQDPPKSK